MSELAPIHPGEVLMEDFITPLGKTRLEVASAVGVPPWGIDEIVHGRRRLAADAASGKDELDGVRWGAVATYVKSLTFDCADALVVARFWAGALGGEVEETSTSAKAFVEAPGWGGPNLWFQRVPEPRTAKNRMHFDLRAPGTVEDEVARLTALGATVDAVHGELTVMRDPEGNEFCVEL